jgi:signal transduction histidine kinase
MLKEEKDLQSDPLAFAALEVFLHRVRNPLAGASALVQMLQLNQQDETLAKILDRIDTAAKMLLEGERFFALEGATSRRCQLAEVVPGAPTVEVAIDQSLLEAILRSLPGKVATELQGPKVFLHIDHDGEANLHDSPPPADSCCPAALSIAAVQHSLYPTGGALYWSGSLTSPAPYTLTLKVSV